MVDSSASIDSPDKISQLTKLIVFELAFVHNSDLQDDNFLLDESKDLWVIDHGNCFGGAWSEGSISGLCNRPMIEIENRFTCATQLWHMAKTGNGLLGADDDICDSIGAGFRLSFPCFALAYWILVMGPCF